MVRKVTGRMPIRRQELSNIYNSRRPRGTTLINQKLAGQVRPKHPAIRIRTPVWPTVCYETVSFPAISRFEESRVPIIIRQSTYRKLLMLFDLGTYQVTCRRLTVFLISPTFQIISKFIDVSPLLGNNRCGRDGGSVSQMVYSDISFWAFRSGSSRVSLRTRLRRE